MGIGAEYHKKGQIHKLLRDIITHFLFWGLLIQGIDSVLILGDGISSKVSDLRLGILKC